MWMQLGLSDIFFISSFFLTLAVLPLPPSLPSLSLSSLSLLLPTKNKTR